MRYARSIHAVWAVAGVLPILVACAAAGSGGRTPNPYTGPITAADLREANVQNVYDAIERLRPRWLRVRAMRSFSIETEVVVFQDRLYLGNQEALRRIGIDGIYQIEYVDGPTAQATLPGLRDRHVEGAIVIHMSPNPEGGGALR